MESSKGRALRRSHVKSKTGCLTCRHKHIRCDELRPQCRNCIKRGYICDFTSASNPATAGSDPASHVTTTAASISTSASTSTPTLTTANNKDENISMSTLWHEISNLQLPDREYFPPLPAKDPLHQQPYPHQHPHSRHGQSPPPSPQPQLNYKQLRSTTEPIENLRMMHHAAQITEGLAMSGGHRLALGTCNLPVFIDLARSHVFVKNALLGLATAHLNCLVKLTALEALGSRYRREACRDLQVELGRFSKGNADAVLAASIMLGWQALDRATYVKFMQGTAQVLKLMPSLSATSQLSELFSPLTLLSAQRQAKISEEFHALSSKSASPYTSASTYKPSQFTPLLTPTPTPIPTPTLTIAPLLHALQTLYAILPSTGATSKTELRTTTLVLQNLLQNFRLLCSTSAKPTASTASTTAIRSSLPSHAVTISLTAPFFEAQPIPFATQFELFYHVRTWLPLMPVSILGVGRRDPWALLVMAYFHVVVVFVVGQLASSSGSGNEAVRSASAGGLGLESGSGAADFGESRREGCGGALFAGRRTEIVVRIDGELEALKKIADVEAELEAKVEAIRERKADEMGGKQMTARERARELTRIGEFMWVPLMYVVDYRSKGFTY